jgi:uncharacterized membrane protein (UPF0127 family)
MELTLVRDNGDVICRRCQIADNPLARLKGLLGRSSIAADEGMLLATSAIHTSFMRFPIDLVFLDSAFVVVKTVSDLRPWRIAHDRRARSVVELAAGVVAIAGVEPREQVSLVRQGQPLMGSGSDGKSPDDGLRVAIASPDSRFLRVTRFLLARHAFEVETYRDALSLLGDAWPGADVVVLDSSMSLAVTARVMRDVAVLSPTTGFVVVGEQSNGDGRPEEESRMLRILPKWDSFDRLVAEIHIASEFRRHGEIA